MRQGSCVPTPVRGHGSGVRRDRFVTAKSVTAKLVTAQLVTAQLVTAKLVGL